MASVGTQYLARGRTDAEDRLLEADGQLADLNRKCGGSVGGTLAIPELLSLVVKSREYGLKLARQFQAFDGTQLITAWVEIAPAATGDGGCDIAISSWEIDSIEAESESRTAQRRMEINRHLAECTARLDSQQRLYSVETDAPDLVEFAKAAGNGVGRPWTDFVELSENKFELPANWRILDGASCRIPGSDREWYAFLEPLGKPDQGCADSSFISPQRAR